eukprot:g4188.t1
MAESAISEWEGELAAATNNCGDDEGEEDLLQVAVMMYQRACLVLETKAESDDEATVLLVAAIDALWETATGGQAGGGSADITALGEDERSIMGEAQLLVGRLLEWKEPDKSLERFRIATECNPAHPEAHLQLARLSWKRAELPEDLAEVERLLRKAIELSGEEGEDGDEGEEDEGEDDEEEDGDEEEDDDGTWKEASRLLARLLYQTPARAEEARTIASRLGFKVSLAHSLTSTDFTAAAAAAAAGAGAVTADWLPGAAPPSGDTTPPPSSLLHSSPPVRAFDNALPPAMLAHLRQALRPGAPFWAEHRYDSPMTGFFSYCHDLGHMDDEDEDEDEDEEREGEENKKKDGGGGEQHGDGSLGKILRHIRRTAAAAVPSLRRKVRFAEWWAHSRPHSNGHKLHYDYCVDPATGKVRHPLVSTVTFLQTSELSAAVASSSSSSASSPSSSSSTMGGGGGAAPPQRVGGPTLITDQTMERDRTTQGWLVPPADNRLCVFDGNLLHCVLPGVAAGASETMKIEAAP